MVVYAQTQKLTVNGAAGGRIVVQDSTNLAPGIYGILSDANSGPTEVRIETIDYDLHELIVTHENEYIDLSVYTILAGAKLFVPRQVAPSNYIPQRGFGIAVQNEGTQVGITDTMDFVGPGVTASYGAGKATITVTGGGTQDQYELSGGAIWTNAGSTGESQFTDENDNLLFGLYKDALVFGDSPVMAQLTTQEWLAGRALPPLPDPIGFESPNNGSGISEYMALYETPSGNIFVYGGNQGRYFIFDSVAREWTTYTRPLFPWEQRPANPIWTNPLYPLKNADTATTPGYHTDFHHAQLADGRVCIWGGEVGNDAAPNGDALMGDFAIWNPADNTWEILAMPFIEEVYEICRPAVRLNDGRLFFYIGDYASDMYWDPDLLTWDYPNYVFQELIFDPSDDSFSRTSSYQYILDPDDDRATFGGGVTQTRLGDGRVMVYGGWNSIPNQMTGLAWDPDNDTWTPLGRNSLNFWPPGNPYEFGWWMYIRGALLPDGRVIVTGGDTDRVPDRSPWNDTPPWDVLWDGQSWEGTLDKASMLYDPVTDTWTGPYVMAKTRCEHAIRVLDGSAIVIGSSHPWEDMPNSELTAERFDADTYEWKSSLTLLPYPFNAGSSCVLNNGDILCLSGWWSSITGAELFTISAWNTGTTTFPVVDFTDGIVFTSISTTSPLLFKSVGSPDTSVGMFKVNLGGIDVLSISQEYPSFKVTPGTVLNANNAITVAEIETTLQGGSYYDINVGRAEWAAPYALRFYTGIPWQYSEFKVVAPTGAGYVVPGEPALFSVQERARNATGIAANLSLNGGASGTGVSPLLHGLTFDPGHNTGLFYKNMEADPAPIYGSLFVLRLGTKELLDIAYDKAWLGVQSIELTGDAYMKKAVTRYSGVLEGTAALVGGTVDVDFGRYSSTYSAEFGEPQSYIPQIHVDTPVQVTRRSGTGDPAHYGHLSVEISPPSPPVFVMKDWFDDNILEEAKLFQGDYFNDPSNMISLSALFSDPSFPYGLLWTNVRESPYWPDTMMRFMKVDAFSPGVALERTRCESPIGAPLGAQMFVSNYQTWSQLACGVCRSPGSPEGILLVGGCGVLFDATHSVNPQPSGAIMEIRGINRDPLSQMVLANPASPNYQLPYPITLPRPMMFPNVVGNPSTQEIVIIGLEHWDNGYREFDVTCYRYNYGTQLWATYTLPFDAMGGEGSTSAPAFQRIRLWLSEGFYYLLTGTSFQRIAEDAADFSVGWEVLPHPLPLTGYPDLGNLSMPYVDTSVSPNRVIIEGKRNALFYLQWDGAQWLWQGTAGISRINTELYAYPLSPMIVDGSLKIYSSTQDYNYESRLREYDVDSNTFRYVPNGQPFLTSTASTSNIVTCSNDTIVSRYYYGIHRSKLDTPTFTINSTDPLDTSEVFWSVRRI